MSLAFNRLGDMRNRKLAALLFLLPLPLIAALAALLLQTDNFPAADLSQSADSAQSAHDTRSAAPTQAISSLTLHPATLVGGTVSRAAVTLRHAAPAGGATVSLSTTDPSAARVPRSVTIPAGQTSAAFDIETSKVAAQRGVGLNASVDGAVETDSLTLLPARGATEWYAAPDGTPKGRGTKDSPWDLATALARGPGRTEVKPGDTVWLRGGRYAGTFVSELEGRASSPVVVRAAPGERATIDRAGVSEEKQPALKVRGPWVWFWGLEVMNSHPERRSKSPYTGKDEPWRGSGADVYAPHVKFINSVFHDNGHGIWDKQDGTEVSGCVFYYNGTNKREHALYVGNTEGTKRLADNIVFAQGGYGILAHSDSPKSSQRGLHIEGNVVFDNGSLTADDQTTGNIAVGGVEGVAAERVLLKNNYVYSGALAPPAKDNGVRLGYEDKTNRDVRLLDNYVAGRRPLRVWWWQSVEARGNTFYARGETLELLTAAGVKPTSYLWDSNTYLGGRRGGPRFALDSDTLDFAHWRRATGLDAHSRLVENESLRPEGVSVFLRPNRHEAGRAHIVVFNWELREQVSVDVSGVLAVGAVYEVRDAQDFFGEPVARGTYTGAPLVLPAAGRRIAPPVGVVERAPQHTSPEFAAYVLLQTSAPPARAQPKRSPGE